MHQRRTLRAFPLRLNTSESLERILMLQYQMHSTVAYLLKARTTYFIAAILAFRASSGWKRSRRAAAIRSVNLALGKRFVHRSRNQAQLYQ